MTKAEEPRRHFVIPDTQTRPGVPLDHLDWVAEYLKERKPDVVVHVGDHWDFPSLNGHEQPGSIPMEGKRFADDLHVGNEAFARLCKPMEAEIVRLARNHEKRWNPRKVFCLGNHEARADRVATNDPRLYGTVGSDMCDTRDWERYPYQQPVEIDGINYCHLFSAVGTGRPIGGQVSNRLTKINASFVAGHEQGKREGNLVTNIGRTLYGLVVGSCYLHVEPYRGPHQRHWRGVVELNEVEDGEYDKMEVSLKFLCRKYTGKPLLRYMAEKYPGQDWTHLK